MGRTTAEIPAFKGRVLLVDDIREDIDSVGHLLHDLGYQVTPVEEPDTVIELAQEYPPRLIVLSADVRHGFNLCHVLKKDPVLRRIPLVLLTAKTSAETIRKHRMLPTRADSYVAKPVEPDRFREAIREVVPEDFLPPREREVGGEPDSIPSSPGALEVAVVTYVEDEVRTLREQVTRLQDEKRDLGDSLADLERRLGENADRFESGLQDLLARQVDSTVAAARITELDAEKARIGEELRELSAENARTAEENRRLAAENSRLADDNRRLEERTIQLAEQNRAAVADREAVVAESREMTSLFERLEAGYKESISALEAERSEIEFMLGRAEASANGLREDSAQLDLARREIARLQEAAARTEILEEEVSKLRTEAAELALKAGRMRELEDVVAALKQDVETAKARDAELAEARAETESLRRLLNTIRSLLNGGS